MKVIIASPHCSKLELIEYQLKTIKKYILDSDYEYPPSRIIGIEKPCVKTCIKNLYKKLYKKLYNNYYFII